MNTPLGARRHQHQLFSPQISKACSNTFLERSIIYSVTCESSTLREHIRMSNIDCFRNSIKTMLFVQQYEADWKQQ